MGKSKTATRAVPSDDSKVVGASASNVTSIAARRRPATPPAADKPTGEIGAPAVEPHLVVFGLDDGGKAHASWFGVADAELAVKAAGMMRFSVLPITTDEHRAAASGLATGRVFASGRAFTPFAKMAAYEALKAFGEAYQPPVPPEPQPEPPLAVTGTPQRWEDIDVGALVLASVGPDEGWFEAVVAEARGDAIFVLRWQGWPDHDAFVRRADGLALLPRTAEAVVGQ